MNKRLRKKIEKNRRRDIHRILDMALDINGLGSRMRDTTGNKPTVFVELMGHIARMEVRVYSQGWDSHCLADKIFGGHFNNQEELKHMTKYLKQYHTLILAETPGAATPRESK